MMLKSSWILIVGFTLFILEADTTTIKWHSAGAPLNNPDAWMDDYLPCAQDMIVFPYDFPAILPLPMDLSLRGFLLPRHGALLLPEDATINVGTSRNAGLSPVCRSDEKRAYLKPPKTSKWFDPNSWTLQPSTLGDATSASNAIMPDLERIPCDDEHVVISSNSGALSFDLEDVQYLRLGQLILAGSSISLSYLQDLMERELGRLLFHNAYFTTVQYYRGGLCGCHIDMDKLVEPVCHNVQEQCEQPHCVSPILPYGACCYTCGAIMKVPTQQCREDDRQSLQKFINTAIEDDDLQDQLLVHVEHVSSKTFGNILQAVVVERGTYSERSTAFMQRLSARRNSSSFLASSKGLKLTYSGHHYNPNVTFTSVMLILFCTVLVGILAIIMLAHFMPEHPYLNRIPQWIHDPRRWHWRHLGIRLRQNLLFNRFDNMAPGAGTAAGSAMESVIGYDAESGEVRERAFNNPMFEQAEDEVATVTSATALPTDISTSSKTETTTAILSPSVETGELDNCSVEEQELTEINLESSEAESDDEAETKE